MQHGCQGIPNDKLKQLQRENQRKPFGKQVAHFMRKVHQTIRNSEHSKGNFDAKHEAKRLYSQHAVVFPQDASNTEYIREIMVANSDMKIVSYTIPHDLLSIIVGFMDISTGLNWRLACKQFASMFHSHLKTVLQNPILVRSENKKINKWFERLTLWIMYDPNFNESTRLAARNVYGKHKSELLKIAKFKRPSLVHTKLVELGISCFCDLVARCPKSLQSLSISFETFQVSYNHFSYFFKDYLTSFGSHVEAILGYTTYHNVENLAYNRTVCIPIDSLYTDEINMKEHSLAVRITNIHGFQCAPTTTTPVTVNTIFIYIMKSSLMVPNLGFSRIMIGLELGKFTTEEALATPALMEQSVTDADVFQFIELQYRSIVGSTCNMRVREVYITTPCTPTELFLLVKRNQFKELVK
jgi:hypothetical protein